MDAHAVKRFSCLFYKQVEISIDIVLFYLFSSNEENDNGRGSRSGVEADDGLV